MSSFVISSKSFKQCSLVSGSGRLSDFTDYKIWNSWKCEDENVFLLMHRPSNRGSEWFVCLLQYLQHISETFMPTVKRIETCCRNSLQLLLFLVIRLEYLQAPIEFEWYGILMEKVSYQNECKSLEVDGFSNAASRAAVEKSETKMFTILYYNTN